METFVLMIFAYMSPDFAARIPPVVVFHSVAGFESRIACESAYSSLDPSGYGLLTRHTCEPVILGTKIPEPMFVVPLSAKREEPVTVHKNLKNRTPASNQ